MISYLIEITPYILEGFKMTFGVFFITLLFSIPFALLLLALSKINFMRPIISAYTWLMRGTPLILQLYFFVFALPIMIPGFITRNAFIGATLAFILLRFLKADYYRLIKASGKLLKP